MPDVFVPIDTTKYSDYHRNLVYNGIMNQFAATYVDKHRAELTKKYKDISSFEKNFQVSPEMLQSLVNMANDEKIKFNEEQYNQSKDMIALQLKALTARDLFDTAGYFRIINASDDSYKKALEIIKNPTLYNKYLKTDTTH